MSGYFRNVIWCGVVALTVGMFASPSQAAVRYVDDSATGGVNSGSDWANAYTKLETGLAASTSGDELWVAAGTYYPTNGTDRTRSFVLKAGVALYGSFVGNESLLTQRHPANHSSVLSGDIGVAGDRSDNTLRIISAASASGARLDGFTITLADNHLNGNFGGGMNVANASPMTIENCLFSDNYASQAGALQLESASTVRNCIFINNSSDGRGGAVQCYTSARNFVNCVFIGNFCTNGRGGALSLYHQATSMLNCSFVNNTAVQGSLYMSNGGSLDGKNCIFWDSGAHGGGIWVKSNSSNPGAGSYAGFCTVTFSDVNGTFNPPELGSSSDCINVDPLYVNSGTGDLHLQKDSPCKDTATPSGAPADDADGGTRPVGAGYDMGAYEFGAAGSGPAPTGVAFFIHSPSANGTNTIPAQWHFEGITPGTAIVTNGLGNYGFDGTPFTTSNNAAVSVAGTPLPVPPNGYPLASATHSNVMQILTAIGGNSGVSASFATNQTAGTPYIYADFMVQAKRLSEEPSTPQGCQAAGYFNSNGHLVVCNALYTNAFSPNLNRSGHNGVPWTELSNTPVDSNDWVRLTITLDYLSAPSGFYTQEHYYRVALNGVVLTSDRAYRSSALDAADGDFPVPAGAGETNAWFLCADSGFGNGALEPANQPNNAFFSAIAFDGGGGVDDVVVSGTPGPPPDSTTTTTSTTTTSTTSSTTTTTTSSSSTTAPDTSPPDPVNNLDAFDDTSTIELHWVNPTNDDFNGIVILRREGAPPSGSPTVPTVYSEGEFIGDGTVVYVGPGFSSVPNDDSQWLDTTLPDAGVFYYAVFAYDADLNYSVGAYTSEPHNPTLDSDGDGMINGDEYVAGTDALDTNSLLRFVGAMPIGPILLMVETDGVTHVVSTQELLFATGVALGWPSESNRYYSLFRGTNMTSAFVPVVSDVPATPPLNTYTSPTAGPGNQFYRIVVTNGPPT